MRSTGGMSLEPVPDEFVPTAGGTERGETDRFDNEDEEDKEEVDGSVGCCVGFDAVCDGGTDDDEDEETEGLVKEGGGGGGGEK